MGRKSMNPPAGDTIVLRDGNFAWDIPAETLRKLGSVGATGTGILLANVSQRFSIMHQDEKGDLPVNYSVSVRISREPLAGNETEANAVATAADESKAKRDADDAKKTKERQGAIAHAILTTKEMIREGMALNPQQSPVAVLKQVAEIAPLLKALKENIA